MAANMDRVPSQNDGAYSSDNGDSKRHHQAMSNSISSDTANQGARGSSNTSRDPYHFDPARYQHARQPINEAVTSAFNNADANSTASFSPELLQQLTSQITASVLQQLKVANPPTPAPQPPLAGPPMDGASSTAGSPPLDRATVYTPPSPYRSSEDAGTHQPSPHFPPPPSSTQSSFRPPSPPPEKRPVSPFSQGSHLSESDANQERPARPKGPKRISTGGDATIVERAWGTLFDEQGQTTSRLGQFLRGIAVHLIEDYEPKNSLVITPTKLQKYYEETKLNNEFYPWRAVFDDRTSSISRMYREIEAQHHLVQEKLNERPDIPGLTPLGFEKWATMLLKAHPDQEFDRLAKTALEMPISNPDDKKERFPKEISRRLFPTRPDTEVAYKLQKALSTHCNVNFASRQGSAASAADTTPHASQSSQQNGNTARSNMRPSPEKQENVTGAPQPSPAKSQFGEERQRQPYSGAPSDSEDMFENSEDTPTPQPIERERKPYVAAPGGGKTYATVDKPVVTVENKPPPPLHELRLGRSNSVHSTSRHNDGVKPNVAIHQRPPPAPLEMPETRHHRSNSTYHRDQPRPGRNRSPSMTKENGGPGYIRRPDATDVPYTSSHHPYTGNDPYEDARRYKEYEQQRERLANDRYDPARMSAYDPRERERERDRETRPRMQSVSAYDGRAPPPYSSSAASTEEDYYRDRAHVANTAGYSTPMSISTGFQVPPSTPGGRDATTVPRETQYGSYPSSAGYPPSAYRDGR
ncbi:hypothetical protein LTR69_000742 [Exophiala sideris]|uniref:DUF7514 domain-containing protein n=1 Tax=Exophiala sideris TaxID=1016849 RepID=A0ABR0JRT6_9EURO|nr:hypothetical protein LTR69_000742 [Exophiala sideris]